MPPLSQLRSPTLNNLYEQLRFAPKPALIRDIERAEQLAGEIDREQDYPEDWIVFRVTGYRPDIEDPSLLSGADLLWDLSAFVERMSNDAETTRAELAADSFCDATDLCERWRISRKTLDRFRKRGLIARRARSNEGQSVLLFSPAVIEAFENSADSPVKRAAGFSRINEADAHRMHRRAKRYRAALGYSLNEAALRLAKRFDRSHEGVRQLLLRQDESAALPVFGQRPPKMDRRKAMVLRAARLGIEPATIASRINRTTASVNRTLIEARADELRRLKLSEPPTGENEMGFIDELSTEVVGETDLAILIERARTTPPPDKATEATLAQARLTLEIAAAAVVTILKPSNVSASNVDLAQTMLRHESRIRAMLVAAQLGNIVRTIEDRLATPLERVRAIELAQLMQIAIAAAASATGSFDPAKGGRLAAPVGMSVSRTVAAWDRNGERRVLPGRATPVLLPGHPIPDFTRSVSPWQSFLEPDDRVRRFLIAVDQPQCEVLALRFGLNGRTPRTAIDTSDQLNLAPTRIAPLMRQGIRQALAASRN